MYIDTATDWSEIDHVLVGTETDLMGILCVADVFARLNNFAEASVLLYPMRYQGEPPVPLGCPSAGYRYPFEMRKYGESPAPSG